MTTPSTPRSSRALSPADSLDTPSRSNNGDSMEVMTPRRKVQAMLAAIDDDSEEEHHAESTALPSRLKSIGYSSNAARSKGTTAILHDDEEEEEEDQPIAPRGRLAARMQAGPFVTSSPVSNDKIAGKKSSPNIEHLDIEEDSDDGIIRSAGRNRIRPAPTSPTPVTPRENLSDKSPSPLFVSPGPPSPQSRRDGLPQHEFNSEDDEEPPVSRFQALVARKRKEQNQRELLEAEEKAERMQRTSELGLELGSDEHNEEDGDDEEESSRRLTQQSRPARKASKKAMLEMNRETQRMARNMQLAHEATTRKKISIGSFLERFNQKNAEQSKTDEGSSATQGSQHSDSEALHSTPPTSPVRGPSTDAKEKNATVNETTRAEIDRLLEGDIEEFPTLEELIADPGLVPDDPVEDTVQDKAVDISPKDTTERPVNPKSKQDMRQVRVRLSRQSVAETQQHDSDSDLEVVTSPSKARRLALFENMPSRNARKEANSLRTLKALAQRTSPSHNNQSSMNQAEFEASLLQKAREQAAKQREEKLDALRAKGVVIQTAEERAREEEQIEDLMEKARDEADQIAKREKEAAKRKAAAEGGPVELGSSDEEDYVENEGDDEGHELSDEEEEEDEEAENNEENDDGALCDNIAQEADESDDDNSGNRSVYDFSEAEQSNETAPQRARRAKFVVSDDEEDGEPVINIAPASPERQIPNLGTPKTPILGLSQAFAATMRDSQQDTQQDSLDQLRKMPGIDLPVADLLEQDSPGIIPNTQNQDNGSLDLLAGFTQVDFRATESPGARSYTAYSQDPEPTQDAGFVMSPFDQRKRFLTTPSSVANTLPIFEGSPKPNEARRRLVRGGARRGSGSDDELQANPKALDVVRRAAKKSSSQFMKKKSKAKDMVEEAAEESDDEYAGLGGASDDDSGSENEFDLSMINDNSGEVVDEKALAALNANHARETDEREVNKLFNDITTGAFRRKRGGGDDFDLSDSDDERIAARRRAKQREFAKMRKALLADEKVGKIADDPKKAAFFKAIEDRDMDDELGFFDEEGEEDADNSASQDTNNSDQQNEQGDVGRKRPLDTAGADVLNRPAAKSRRTAAKQAMKKPLTLAEIRESVSFLIDGPDTDAAAPSSAAAVENLQPEPEDAVTRTRETASLSRSTTPNEPETHTDTHNQTFTHPRRRPGTVVDRLSLRRQASSNAAASSNANKFAFHSNQSRAGPTDFKRPSFLQRRSTSSLTTMSSTSGSSIGSGSSSNTSAVVVTSESGGVQGGRKGAVNYYAAARDKEREIQLKKHAGGDSSSKRAALVERYRMAGGGLTGLLKKDGQQWE